ncbi:MAG: hypothetical protein KFB95_05105 [Simkaniaceae bacterium]|nr:MAG: hypothetical protein KFB95_05105 [Simkaniaceae bacterium]
MENTGSFAQKPLTYLYEVTSDTRRLSHLATTVTAANGAYEFYNGNMANSAMSLLCASFFQVISVAAQNTTRNISIGKSQNAEVLCKLAIIPLVGLGLSFLYHFSFIHAVLTFLGAAFVSNVGNVLNSREIRKI